MRSSSKLPQLTHTSLGKSLKVCQKPNRAFAKAGVDMLQPRMDQYLMKVNPMDGKVFMADGAKNERMNLPPSRIERVKSEDMRNERK